MPLLVDAAAGREAGVPPARTGSVWADAIRNDEAMTEDENRVKDVHPVLLCFDGSNDAATAIAKAGALLGPRTAVVLTVWEPAALWAPYDPATILTAPMSRLASKGLGLDEIASQVARVTSDRGVALARTDLRFGVVSRKARPGERSATRLRGLTPSRSWSVPGACRVSSRRFSAACRLPSSCTRTAQCSSSRATEGRGGIENFGRSESRKLLARGGRGIRW